jgi:hypothetical protein
MNIALLGFDPDLERVAVAAIADKRHSVQLTCVPERWRESVRRLAPRATEVRDWESLLAATDLDAVLIGRDRPGDVESLKKLAQTGIPLLLIHPVGDPLLGARTGNDSQRWPGAVSRPLSGLPASGLGSASPLDQQGEVRTVGASRAVGVRTPDELARSSGGDLSVGPRRRHHPGAAWERQQRSARWAPRPTIRPGEI